MEYPPGSLKECVAEGQSVDVFPSPKSQTALAKAFPGPKVLVLPSKEIVSPTQSLIGEASELVAMAQGLTQGVPHEILAEKLPTFASLLEMNSTVKQPFPLLAVTSTL